MTTLVAFVGGVAFVGAVVLAVSLRYPAPVRPRRQRRTLAQTWARATGRPAGAAGRHRDVLLVASLALGVVVFLWTGWLVAIVAVPVATLLLPKLLGKAPPSDTELLEALDRWVQALATTMPAGLARAEALARSMRADLVLAHVYPMPWRAPNEDAVDASGGPTSSSSPGRRSIRSGRLPATYAHELTCTRTPRAGAGWPRWPRRRRLAIVIGRATGGEPGRLHGGSTSDQLLHGASVPVLLSRRRRGRRLPRGRTPSGRVTVAYQRSLDSAEALHAATQLCRRTGAPLRLVTLVVHPPRMLPSYERALDDLRADARHWLDEALVEAPFSTRLTAEIAEGEDFEEAMAAVDSEPDELLVCGSGTAGPLRRVFLGDTARRSCGSPTVPVLVVPRHAESELDHTRGIPRDPRLTRHQRAAGTASSRATASSSRCRRTRRRRPRPGSKDVRAEQQRLVVRDVVVWAPIATMSSGRRSARANSLDLAGAGQHAGAVRSPPSSRTTPNSRENQKTFLTNSSASSVSTRRAAAPAGVELGEPAFGEEFPCPTTSCSTSGSGCRAAPSGAGRTASSRNARRPASRRTRGAGPARRPARSGTRSVGASSRHLVELRHVVGRAAERLLAVQVLAGRRLVLPRARG